MSEGLDGMPRTKTEGQQNIEIRISIWEQNEISLIHYLEFVIFPPDFQWIKRKFNILAKECTIFQSK